MDFRPSIVDSGADVLFVRLLQKVYPRSYEWENRYVEHEACRVRHVCQPGICEVGQRRVLEYGCNIGATSIVLALLGGTVIGCDINDELLTLAALNARRYGVSESIQLVRIQESGALPFASNSFDIITCNSVLEYVHQAHFQAVLRELDRVLRPGGQVVIYGTSNRLWPIEPHSGAWLVNYLPRFVDRWSGRSRARGIWPWQIRRAFRQYEDTLGRQEFDVYLRALNGSRYSKAGRCALQLASWLAKPFGATPGILTPFLFMILRKPRK